MGRTIKITLICLAFFCLFTHPLFAAGSVKSVVMVIQASTSSNHVDSGLNSIISELKSVFKYTSYRLLNNQRLTQQFNQQSSVNLPGNRTLLITPTDMNGKRIKYQIVIQRGNKSIFQTQVLLKNNNSITIGGPQHEDGVLLFNIMGSAQ
jgi:hypothetical protein